jgi:hypothetical protein
LVVNASMSTPTENVDRGPTTLTPAMRRLLNKPLLCKGRSALVMSPRKRAELVRRDEAQRAFLNEHPWWGQIEGYQREIIRRLIDSLSPTGQTIQSARLEWFIFTAGDVLGKDVIWPILDHLLGGGGFHAEGMEIREPGPHAQTTPSVPFLDFLSAHLPAGTRPVRVDMVRLLLKARVRLQELVEAACLRTEESGTEGAAVATA